jgi:Virulence protein RhuM family
MKKPTKPPVEPSPESGIILYQTEDGRTRIQCRFEDETVWLSQKLMAELFQKDVRTVNEHVQNILAEGELAAGSGIRKFRITAADGKGYETQHYNLEMVIAVGYRVNSPRGTQFRQWATARLNASGGSMPLPRAASRAMGAIQAPVLLALEAVHGCPFRFAIGFATFDVLALVVLRFASTHRDLNLDPPLLPVHRERD